MRGPFWNSSLSWFRVRHEVEDAVFVDDLLGAFRPSEGLLDLPGVGRDHGDGRLNAQRGADALAGHNHPVAAASRTALQPVQIADPLVKRMFPQHHAVKRIARR